MHLQESGEMYLETIYVLEKSGKPVRSLDVAVHLGYSKPSVSRAIKLLKNGGFITVDEQGFISLTDSGKKVANKIFERHTVIASLLKALGVDDETAANDACKIEHVISDTSFEAMKKHFKKTKE